MAGITRSGRGLKNDGTSTMKIGRVPAEVAKDESTSSITVNAKNKVGSLNNNDKTNMMSTRTVVTDVYNLRKSCRDTPKKSTPNSGSKKPVKPESSVLSTPNKKRPHSPLRRSERIEKIGVSGLPNAKKSIENMTPSKKRKTDVNGSKNKKLDLECEGTSKKRKNLSARNYVRSIFSSDDNEISDDEGAHLEDDVPTKDTSANLSLSTSGLHVCSDDCNSSKEDKFCGENNDDSSKVFADDSCSGSRQLAVQRNLVHKSGKDIIHDSHKLMLEDSRTEDGSVFVVDNLERAGNFTGLDNETTNAGHSPTSVKSGNTDICTTEVFQANTDICTTKVSQADTTSLLPNHDSSDGVRSHTICNKFERGTFGVCNGTSNSKENQIESQNESLAVVQTDGDSNACNACKQSGNLLFLCCGGKNCQEKYHLSCLSPPLQNIPSGIWLCGTCVKKKVELGVHSVSQGIESIWDVKEEVGKGKIYLVKYAGLAHVHNQWVPESQLLSDAVNLIDKFNKKGKKGMATRWKQEWTVPQRILQKRLLTPTNIAGAGELLYCYTEYLVKWKCLGYDSATWELEKEPFLCTSFGKKLISDFENRIKEAKKASDPSRVRTVQLSKKNSLHTLSRIPDDWPIGVDNVQWSTVNQLLERWQNSHHAVLNVDQERIMKSILFLYAIKPYTCQPVLVVSTVHSLSLWEAEFARLAPSINVVVYTGNKNTRKLIRNLEFYEDSGCIMFQVMLSHPNAIIEDFDTLDSVGWELLVVDDCQHPHVSNHLETFKNIPTKFRLLLLNSQLKDNDAEYLNLLSLLESGGKENNSICSKSNVDGTLDTITVLKKKLACYLIEHVQKPKLTKFVEYWVPVHLSNVQLEQYCSTLVSNYIILQSSIKIDHVGALRDILISTRKCCDHPYLVSQSLQTFLSTPLPLEKYLDVGVMASSKLLLLDRFLHEIKKKELRALILYQSIGQVRDSIGDILDDFVSQRFGSDSFERVDSGLQSSRKIAALNKFNDKANGRFVFLLESHACLPSIKLSSVDVVVIFDSDWNPLNDLRALQKIQIDSQSECIDVFRLYVSRTIEEKVLIFAKHTVLDSHIQGLSPGNSHLLLSWGAKYLFSQLDEFHRRDKHEYSENCLNTCFFDESASKFLDDVVVELVNCLSRSAKKNMSEYLFLIKAHQNGALYSKNIKLAGEKDGMSSFDNDPSVSWSNIFQNRHFNWKFITFEPSQRSRRKARLFSSSLNATEIENGERKKCRKLYNEDSNGIRVPDDADLSRPQLVSSTMSPALASKVIKKPDGVANHATRKCPSFSKPENIMECEGKHTAQGDLYLQLKPKLSELSDILKLPDEVKSLTHVLHEYIMKNHSVNRNSETILQALMLSLCWRAASLLKHKLDHKECLALANKYLKYKCSKEEANSVYSHLRMLKKKFSQLPTSEHEIEPGSVGKLFSSSEEANALEVKDVSDEHRSSESKESSAPGRVSKPNSLESPSSAFGKADYPQHLKEDFDDNRSSENNKVLAFRCENLPKPFGNQSEPREPVVDQGNLKKNPTSSESQEVPSSRHEYVPCRNHSSTLKESDETSVVSRKTNVASDQNLGYLKDILLRKRIDLVEMVWSSRKNSLVRRQQQELSDFDVRRETERILMNKLLDAQIDLIHTVHVDHTIRSEKIRLLNLFFTKKMTEYDEHMLSECKKLTIMQESAMNKENEIRDLWLEDARAGTLVGSFDTLPLTETGFELEKFKGISDLGNADDMMTSLIRAEVPNALFTENNSEFSSTPPSRISAEMPRSTEPYNGCTDIPGLTSNIVSTSVVELHPAGSNKTCSKIRRSTLDSTVSTPAEVQPLEPNENCSKIKEHSLLPITLTGVEEEAAHPNIIGDDILESSSNPTLVTVADKEPIEQNKTCAETSGMSSDLLPSSAEAETIELNGNCSEIPKSMPDPITSSIEMESNEQHKLCNTNSGLTSNPLPFIEAATDLCKMVDEIPRSITDNSSASVIEKAPTKPNSKGGELLVVPSDSTSDPMTNVSLVGPAEISETDPTIVDPSKACTENLGPKTDSIPSSTIEGEFTESNRTHAETPSWVLGLAYNNATTISTDYPIDETHVEIPTVVLPAIDIGVSLEKEVPSETAVNETVAERLISGMIDVEPIETHENSTENLAPESIPLIKENEIISSESVEVVEVCLDPSSCLVENLDISKETDGLHSHNIIKSALKQIEASDELSLEKEVPSKTTDNEIVAERTTIGMVAVESFVPLENPAENLASESIPLTKGNEIPASESIDVVQECVGAESSLCPVENLDTLKENEGLPSHKIIKSAIEHMDASDEQIIHEGEKTVGGHEIRLTSLQTEDALPSTMHLEMDFCTATSNTDSNHEKDSLANLGSSHVEVSVDDYPLTENAQAHSPQPHRIEEHIVDAISNMFNASAEISDQLAVQPVLPLPPSSEAEMGISSSNSHGELTAQQLTVQESVQVHQSIELSPRPILHLPPLTDSEVVNLLNLQRNMPAQQTVVNDNLQAGPSNLSLPSILHSLPAEEDLMNELLSQQSNQLTSQPIMHPPPPFENVGMLNSESVLPVQRPILNGSLHADQPTVSGYQSSEHFPSSSTTSLAGRSQPEVNAGTSVSREPESRGIEFSPITSLIHPQALHPDPLQNELTRIHKQIEIRRKMHEDKRSRRKQEREEELEKVRKKYEALFQEDDSEYNKDKKYLDTIYNKVLINRILAEQFRSNFLDTKPSSSSFPRGRSSSPLPQLNQLQMLQGHPTSSPAQVPSPRPSSVPSAPRPSSVPFAPRPPSVPSAPRPSVPSAPRPSSVPFAPRPTSVPSAHRPSVPSGPRPSLPSGPRPSMPSAPRTSPMLPFGPPARYTSAPPSSGPSNTSTPPPGLVHTTPSVIPTIPNLRPPQSEARTTPAPRAPAPHLHRYRPPPSSLPSSAAAAAPISISSLPGTAVQPVDATGSSIGKLNLNPSDLRVMPLTIVGSNLLTAISEAAPPPAATATTTAGDDVVCLSDDE